MRGRLAAADGLARACGLASAARPRPAARKRRWALSVTTCGAALVLASCIATDRERSGSARGPDGRPGMGAMAQGDQGGQGGFAAGTAAPGRAGDSGSFAVAPSSTNWLPRERDERTHGSAGVTGGHALSRTGSDTRLLDRWSRSSFRADGGSGLRNAYDAPWLDDPSRHSWSIDVDAEPAGAGGGSRSPEGGGEQVFSFTGTGSFADGLDLALKGESVEFADFGGEEIAGFRLDRSDEWRKGTSSDFQVSLGVLEDRLRFTTRHGMSRYEDDDMAREETGNALVQRLEADLLKTDDLRLGFFGSYARTDSGYTPLEDMLDDKGVKKRLKERDKQGAFAEAGRERTKFGGTLGVGPST